MIDVIGLQDKLISEPELITKVVESLGHQNINDKGKYISFSNIDGDNKTACSILKSNLSWQNYSRNKSGNIFTMVMDELNIKFPEALEWVANTCNIKAKHISKNIHYPFGGFYKEITKSEKNPELNMKVYGKSDINKYLNKYNKRFLDDGVDLKTQEFFGLGYSHEDNAILIPIYSYDGQLVGCKCRNNEDCELSNRWWAMLPYSKTLVLYGFYQNYQSIIQKKICIIVEAEKSVMQAYSFGCYVVLAIGGHNISETQARYIKMLMCEKVIVAFDEGINEEEIQYEAKKLIVDNKINSNQVGYIYDDNNKYLPKGGKDSPTDYGKEIFNKLIKEKTKWIGGNNGS